MSLIVNRKALATIIGLFAIGTAQADTFSADVNDDAFKIEYKATNTGSNLDINASILHHDDDGEIYAVGAQVEGQSLQQANLEGSLGGKMYYIDLDGDADGIAFGLGGLINLSIPRVQGLSAQLEAYYSPDVLSFNDIEHHVDLSAKVKYRVLDNGTVYLGYRKSNVDIKDAGDGDLDEGLHVGIELDL